MITKVQSGNNETLNFGALKPLRLGKKAQSILTKADDFSSVHQRLAIGAFAVCIQPLIDLKNKDVDEDTRKVSAARSIAKAIIGTMTGIVVRGGCMRLTERAFAKKDAAGKILKEAGKIQLDTKKILKTFGSGFKKLNLQGKELQDAVNRLPSVVGTLVALGVMVFTNFLIDAPLTNKTMDKINNFVQKRDENKQKENAEASNG